MFAELHSIEGKVFKELIEDQIQGEIQLIS